MNISLRAIDLGKSFADFYLPLWFTFAGEYPVQLKKNSTILNSIENLKFIAFQSLLSIFETCS